MVDLKIEHVDIPIKLDNINLKGSIYFSSKTLSKAPWIINCAGLLEHRDSYIVKLYSYKFAKAGYYVLSYDYQGMGETARETGQRWDKMLSNIFSDISKVITWIFENHSERLLDSKIVLFGRSLGGAIVLTHGFIDERAKILISLSTRYDYSKYKLKFPKEVVQQISPKYFLRKDPINNDRILTAHCKDDKIIPIDNIFQIKEHLGLSNENFIIFNKGGHSFKGHREEIFKKSIEFLKKL